MCTIKEVTTLKELKCFIDFPYELYQGNPYYVPPLKNDEKTTLQKATNPAFDFCQSRYWLAFHNDKIVGRIAGIINHAFVSKWGKKFMRFGWYDYYNYETVAQSLLQKVEEWARDEGMDAVHGPLGFTNLDPGGMLVKGFNQIATLAELYNYPYYPTHIEKAGYHKEVDWIEFKITVPPVVPPKIEQLANIVKRRNGLTVIKPQPKEIEFYSRAIFNLINVAYDRLHGMVPLTEKQIEHYTKRYAALILKDYVALVINPQDELIAFGITIPSLSTAFQKAGGSLFPLGFYHILKALKRNHAGELCLVAIRPDYQGKGVNALLMEEINKGYIRNKIKVAESNPELEDNTRVQSIWTYYEAQCHKRRRCYIKYLNGAN
jgi:GNAT superfamily N-acetyltransferase